MTPGLTLYGADTTVNTITDKHASAANKDDFVLPGTNRAAESIRAHWMTAITAARSEMIEG